jgi:hypothetical protein
MGVIKFIAYALPAKFDMEFFLLEPRARHCRRQQADRRTAEARDRLRAHLTNASTLYNLALWHSRKK